MDTSTSLLAELRGPRTLQEIAARVGVAPSTILRWERGDTRPPMGDQLRRLLDALDVPPEARDGVCVRLFAV